MTESPKSHKHFNHIPFITSKAPSPAHTPEKGIGLHLLKEGVPKNKWTDIKIAILCFLLCKMKIHDSKMKSNYCFEIKSI